MLKKRIKRKLINFLRIAYRPRILYRSDNLNLQDIKKSKMAYKIKEVLDKIEDQKYIKEW